MNTHEEKLDEIETQLLWLFELDDTQSANELTGKVGRVGKETYEEYKQDDAHVIGEIKAQAPLVVLDDSRLFDPNPANLLAPVHELVGDFFETAFFMPDFVKWNAVERLKRLPPRYTVFGPPGCLFYAIHFREIQGKTSSRYGRYIRRLVAWNPATMKAYGVGRSLQDTSNQFVKEARITMTLCASLREDSSFFWNVRVANGKAITVYSDERAIKELAQLRDNPLTASGRRKPILHWVKSHQRKIELDKQVGVEGHLRGITDFTLNDFKFSITNPDKADRGYEQLLADRAAYTALKEERRAK